VFGTLSGGPADVVGGAEVGRDAGSTEPRGNGTSALGEEGAGQQDKPAWGGAWVEGGAKVDEAGGQRVGSCDKGMTGSLAGRRMLIFFHRVPGVGLCPATGRHYDFVTSPGTFTPTSDRLWRTIRKSWKVTVRSRLKGYFTWEIHVPFSQVKYHTPLVTTQNRRRRSGKRLAGVPRRKRQQQYCRWCWCC